MISNNNAFISSMTMMTRTENGELAYATTQPIVHSNDDEKVGGRVNLFFQSVRDIDDNDLHQLLANSYAESPEDTLRICFINRACRKDAPSGKGERDIFRKSMAWFVEKDVKLLNSNLHFVPLMGRYDDLLYCGDGGVKLFAMQLRRDLQTDADKSISLAAKWAPSPKKRKILRNKLCEALEVNNEAEYRKEILRPLRRRLSITEIKMCANQWNDIDFEKVPAKCMLKNSKVFRKYMPERVETFVDKVKQGDIKAKTSGLMPHELIRDIDMNTEWVELQWTQLMLDIATKCTSLGNALAICDVSGSMSGVPINAAIALSLMCSELAAAPFQHCVMPFSNHAEFVNLSHLKHSLKERVHTLHRMKWEMSTNIGAVVELILNTALRNNVPQKDMPTTVFIFTDMQFNECCVNLTTLETIKLQYHRAKYRMPTICFWNLRATKSFPAQANDENVILLSGFDASLFNMITSNDRISPWLTLKALLNDLYYKRIGYHENDDETSWELI